MSIVSNSTIEQEIYTLFTQPGRTFAKVELGQFPDGTCPGLNVAVSLGSFSFASNTELRQEITIEALVAVKNIRNESERRRLAHPLVEHVIQRLTGNDLGLEIAEIVPVTWSEKTTAEQFRIGELVMSITFRTSSYIPAVASDEDDPNLDSIFAAYEALQSASTTQPQPPLQANLNLQEST